MVDLLHLRSWGSQATAVQDNEEYAEGVAIGQFGRPVTDIDAGEQALRFLAQLDVRRRREAPRTDFSASMRLRQW